MFSDIDVLYKERKNVLNIEIQDIPIYRIAYIRRVGPYGQNNAEIMERIKLWAGDNGLQGEQSVILGIAHDNPAVTASESCRYDTGLVLPGNYPFKDEFIREGNIQGGKYAVFKITHTAEAVQEAWQAIFPQIYGLGCQLDETRPILERYQAELVKNHLCEICVPVK
jgi:DNA gyrase inhibitor GyrI